MSIDIKIPGYELKERAGRGGMATVYRAVQENFGRDVALKIMAPHLGADPAAAARFQREARIVSQMHHGNIVPVYDVGEYQGHAFLAMEFLEGGHLRGRIGQLNGPEHALEICIPIAMALDYAHSKGILHRDVKPDNILFREDGTPLLTDFGIARSADGGQSLTKTGVTIGTFAYMSPEQALGQALDGRTDLYSLGIVLYELLMGVQPYRAESTGSMVLQHLNAPIPRLPPPLAYLQPVLDRALAKNPSERYATGAQMAQAMRECLRSPHAPAPNNVRVATGRGARNLSARAAVLIGGVSAAVLATAAFAIWPGVRAPTLSRSEEAPTGPSVSVPAIVPPTLTLRADPPAIRSGQSTTLRWQAANATSVMIEPGVGAVANDGARTVRPSKSTTYTARTTGPGGAVVTSVAVIVEPRDEPPPKPTLAPAEASAPPAPAPRVEPVPIVATAPQEPKPEPVPVATRMLPNRTQLSAMPVSEICEQSSRVDDPVEMRLSKPVTLSDGSSLPVDTALSGRIAAKRLVGNQPPLVELEAQRLTIDGSAVDVIANPFSFYMSRPSVGGRIAKGAVIGAAAGAVVGLILKKKVGVAAAGGAIVGGAIGAASGPSEACISQTDTTFVFTVTRDTAIR